MLSLLYPPPWAFGVGFALSNVMIFGALWAIYAFGPDWFSRVEVRRLTYGLVALASVASLVGTATNLAIGLWDTNSPLLFVKTIP